MCAVEAGSETNFDAESLIMFQKRVLTAILMIASLGIVSCSANDDGGAGADKVSSVQATAPTVANGSHYPVVIGNCGRELVVKESPQQVVSLNQGMTEILLSMGLEDRLIGTATWTDPVLPHLEQANDGIERLSDDSPSFHTVLAAEPDFVVASFTNTLADVASGSFERYAEVGVPAYMSYAECAKVRTSGVDDGERSYKMRMDDVYQDIRDLGNIFDEVDTANQLIRDLDVRLNAIDSSNGASLFARGKETSVAFWFSSATAPYFAGGYGAPQIIADMLDLQNIYEDSTLEWPQVSWEDIAEKDPDVLILGDLTRRSNTAESAAEKVEFLKNNPVTKDMEVVKNDRFIFLPGGDMNPSIRTVAGVEKVAAALDELDLR